jgi:group I intron endonuclease
MGCIYKITNKINNKIYIGQTIRTLNKRIDEYKKTLKKGILFNDYLHKAFQKYGFDSFLFTVIEDIDSIDELNEKEIFYIKKYNSNHRAFGYNIQPGGRNAKLSEETKKKMSLSRKGKKQNENWVKNRIAEKGSTNAKKYGKPKTDEEKKYLSENSPKHWSGKKRSEETKKKISETKLNNHPQSNSGSYPNRTVHMTNAETGETIKMFDSTKEAGVFMNVHQSTISRWCLVDKKIDNIVWSYKNKE